MIFDVLSFWFVILLYIKSEYDDISVFYDVLFSFLAYQSFFFACVHAAMLDQIVIGYNFGTDKAALKIGMDLAGCLRSLGSFLDCPCASLVLS